MTISKHVYVTVELDVDVDMKDEKAVRDLKNKLYNLVQLRERNCGSFYVQNYHVMSAFGDKGEQIL